jgi:hypothetical protein
MRVVGLVLFALAASSSFADTIYANFGAPLYNGQTGWVVSGPSSGPGQISAGAGFTAAASGRVGQINIGIGRFEGSGTAIARLWTDENGLPGTELGSWTFSSNVIFGTCCELVTIPVIGGPVVVLGNQYFLTLDGVDESALTWNLSPDSGTGLISSNGEPFTQSTNSQLGAFAIFSTPEPSTVSMLSTAGLLAGGLLLRKNRARR